MGWSSCLPEGEPGGGLPPGVSEGDILFWNGSEWVPNAEGTPDVGDVLIWDGATWGLGAMRPTSMLGIPNVTQLRARVGISGEVVALLGYTNPNDGGQGMFQWMTTNGVDDGGTRFNAGDLASNAPGWQRM